MKQWKTRRISRLAMVLLLGFIISSLLGGCTYDVGSRDDIYIEGVENYNTKQYPVSAPFPVELENFGNEIIYSWHWERGEGRDRYLELVFDSETAYTDCLEKIFTDSIDYLHTVGITSANRGDVFLSEQNPYDESFVDHIYLPYNNHNGAYRYAGYYSSEEGGKDCIRVDFCSISCSVEALTVVITQCSGTYEIGKDELPSYFERFSVRGDEIDARLHEVRIAY